MKCRRKLQSMPEAGWAPEAYESTCIGNGNGVEDGKESGCHN